MKAELDGLGPEQLKPGDNQGQIRWALDELQKSDPKWVSEWATRRVLDKSIWFGAWGGLITQISDEQQEELYARFSTELLDKGEEQRVVSVLVSVMSPALAARVFDRAREIRAELTKPPGHDQAKLRITYGRLKICSGLYRRRLFWKASATNSTKSLSRQNWSF